jgi:hypothetical protein
MLDEVLRAVQLEEFHDKLLEYGVVDIEDVANLLDDELIQIGLTKVEMRRLKRHLTARSGCPRFATLIGLVFCFGYTSLYFPGFQPNFFIEFAACHQKKRERTQNRRKKPPTANLSY